MLAQAVQISNIVNGRVVYASENLENDRIEVFLYDLSSSQATRFGGYDRRPKENSIIEITSIYYDGADVLLALTSATSLEDESSGFARVLKKDVRSGQETVLLQLNLPYRLTVFDDRNQELLYARASMGSVLVSRDLQTGKESELLYYTAKMPQRAFLLSPSRRFVFSASNDDRGIRFEHIRIFDRKVGKVVELPESLRLYFTHGEWKSRGERSSCSVGARSGRVVVCNRRGIVNGDGAIDDEDIEKSNLYAWDVQTHQISFPSERGGFYWTLTKPTVLSGFLSKSLLTSSAMTQDASMGNQHPEMTPYEKKMVEFTSFIRYLIIGVLVSFLLFILFSIFSSYMLNRSRERQNAMQNVNNEEIVP